MVCRVVRAGERILSEECQGSLMEQFQGLPEDRRREVGMAPYGGGVAVVQPTVETCMVGFSH